MLKYPEAEENVTTASWKEFYSSEGAVDSYLPNVLITFRNNNGLESYWDYTTSSAGRAGTGCVNQYSGNLVWIRDDIGFGGNRMPVTISHVYNANDSTENQFANTAYFDGVQLYKEEFGNSYTYDEKGNIVSVKGVQGQTTSYEYTNNDLTKQILPSGAALTYTYDSYHNVKTATSDTGVVYNFAYDTYGNNTNISIVSGSAKLSSSASYTSDGNRLASTTDAAGKVTTYCYHENTNVLEWVQYPEDTTATRTEYTYDNMYRLAKAEADVSTGSTLTASYGYTNDLLTSIKTGSTTYSFTYGAFALRSNVKIGSRTLASYSYTSRNNFLASLDYGNGDSVLYTYDKQGRVTKQTYEDGDTVTYKYDNNGYLASVADSASGISTKYIYDLIGRTAAVERRVGDSITLRTEQSYDSENQLTGQSVKFADGTNYTNSLTYNPDGTPMGMVSGVVGTGYNYDELTRIFWIDSEINVLDREYIYRSNPNTNQITQLKYENLKGGYNFDYTYDNMGNIKTYRLDCVNNNYDEAEFTYTYDSQNQLLSATDGTLSLHYSYDNAGNLVSANGHTYTYGDASWGDLLTGYDGQSITYDTIGNPISYYNGTRWTFTWKHGRQLATASNGTNRISYTYDHDGLRTSKTVDGVVYNYYYVGSQLARMTYGDYVLDFFYDANGTPIAMRQGYASSSNYTVYYYITNLQGDVIRLVDVNGNTAAYYEYDPYGNAIHASGSHATINPLRYRGYVYDSETGLYYLQSRYYDPKIGRFINADDASLLGANGDFASLNLFAYCGNNPVMREDRGGNFWLVSVGVGLATQYIGDVIGNLIDGKTGADVFKPTSTVGVYIAAGVTALIPGTGLGGALVRNIVAEGITIIEDTILGNEVNVVDSMINVGLGTVLDVGFEKVSDKAADFISSKMPQNYSSYAHTARQSNPNLTREQIYRSMQRSIRFNRVASKAVSIGFDIVRSTLPY